MKKIIKELEKIIKEDKEFWPSWYEGILEDNVDNEKLETDEDKINYLECREPNGEYDNLMYSQGFVAGLNIAIRLLEKGK